MRGLTSLLLLLPLATAAADLPVTTEPLGTLLSRSGFSAPATVVARNSPAMASEISARIEAIPVHVGDAVAAGTVVAHLDCRLYESQLAAANAGIVRLEAQREFAASQLERAAELRTRKGISDEVVEQRQSELAGLEAQLTAQHEAVRQAALQREHCDVVAPFDAVVTGRLADVGSLASPGTPLVRLVQVDDLEVSAALRDPEAEQLDQADGTFFAWQGRSLPVRLRVLVPVVDSQARTREARLVFTGDRAPPGAAGRLEWQGTQWLLPPEYLVRRDGTLGVFYVNDGKAHFHPLPGALEGQPAPVTLGRDSRIVVQGRHRLADGDPVSDQSASPVSRP